MTIRRSIIEPNFDSFFDAARPGQPALLRIKLKVTLVPLDPSTPWARIRHSATLPGTAAGPLPPSHLAASSANFKKGNVVDADNNGVSCRSWLATEWAEFTRRFKHSVENAWNNQMVFLPVESGDANEALSDADFRQMIGNPRMPAHVEGALEIDLQPPGTIGHAVIEVAHLANPGVDFRDRMTRISDESVQYAVNKFTFGAPRGVGGRTGQIAAAHEVGHWLRGSTDRLFNHIDRETTRNLKTKAERDDGQYGTTLGRFYSMMGGGSLVSDHDAVPWITRLRRQTSMKTGWVFVHKLNFRWSPDDVSARQKRLLLAAQFMPKILQTN